MNLVFKPCMNDDSYSYDNDIRPIINPGCLYFSEPV